MQRANHPNNDNNLKGFPAVWEAQTHVVLARKLFSFLSNQYKGNQTIWGIQSFWLRMSGHKTPSAGPTHPSTLTLLSRLAVMLQASTTQGSEFIGAIECLWMFMIFWPQDPEAPKGAPKNSWKFGLSWTLNLLNSPNCYASTNSPWCSI